MDNSDYFRRGDSEEVGVNIAGRRAPYLSGVLPRDFPERLERLKEASGLTWDAFADAIGIDRKRVHTWRRRKKGDKKPVKAGRRRVPRPREVRGPRTGRNRHPHGRRIPAVPLAGLAGTGGTGRTDSQCPASEPITAASAETPSRTTFPRAWSASRKPPG